MNLQDSLYSLTAKESGLTADQAEQVGRSLFGYVAHCFEAKKLQAVRLPHLCLFHCKPTRVAKLRERGAISL